MNSNRRELIAELEKEGWRFVRTAKGHWRGVHQRAPRKVLIISGTASDWRADANAKADARRLVS